MTLDFIPAPLLAVLAAACFGAAIVVSKPALNEIPPLAGTLVSIPTTTFFLWLLSPFLLDLDNFQVSAVAVFVAVGIFFPALVSFLNFEANKRMGPTISSTLSSTAPIFAVLGALIFLHERLTLYQALALAVIVAGVMLLSMGGKDRRRHWPLWALLFPIGAAFFRGLAQAGIRYGLLIWQNIFAALLIGYTMSSLALLAANATTGTVERRMYRRGIVVRFWCVGGLNGAGMLFSYVALRNGQVTQIAPILASFPLFTFFL
ncbi:MAG TPA: DMT family transporter, partial [Verrucomicrobiae bacterium]|nr:DMT family transporter [Verrucomicrobiae bacterium]